jgi:hypothetical protein
MLNLFLAILLGNFDSARQLMAKKRAFEEFKRLHKKKVPLSIALEIILGDLGEYVKNNILLENEEYLEKSIDEEKSLMKFSEVNQSVKFREVIQQKLFETPMNEEEKINSGLNERNTAMNHKTNTQFVGSRDFKLHEDDSFKYEGKGHNDHKDLHLKTAYTKTDMGIEQMFKSNEKLNPESLSKESERDSEDAPANQQEGFAYDLKLNYQNGELDVENIMEDSKVNEIDDYEAEDSKNVDDFNSLEQTKKELNFPNTARSVRSSDSKSISVQPEEFEVSTDDEIEYKIPTSKRVWDYMKRSSLFIFHESFVFRQWLIMIVISTENLTTKKPKSLKTKLSNQESKENNTDHAGNDESVDSFDYDFDETMTKKIVYDLSHMKIVDGKIITTKKKVMISRWFENFIIFLIILNSLALVLDNPLENPNGTLSRTFYFFDIIFTICFAIEAAMKITAMGFFSNNMPGIEGYIMNGWNILDFIIVVSSLVDLGFTITNSGANTESLKSLKALRAFRALRPLRVISRNEGLQIVVSTLFASLPALRNVMMVMCLILLIFAIMGVNFFKGTFFYCSLSSSLTTSEQNSILDSVITSND